MSVNGGRIILVLAAVLAVVLAVGFVYVNFVR